MLRGSILGPCPLSIDTCMTLSKHASNYAMAHGLSPLVSITLRLIMPSQAVANCGNAGVLESVVHLRLKTSQICSVDDISGDFAGQGRSLTPCCLATGVQQSSMTICSRVHCYCEI